MTNRKITAWALGVLMALEGFKLVAYRDIAGIWTNGYGNTHNVVPGSVITPEQAKADLERNVKLYSDNVVKTLGPNVPQPMLDAFTLLSFNIGIKGFNTSQTVRSYKAQRYMDACFYMLRWDKATVQGTLRPVRGLATRRYTEYNICLMGVPNADWSQVPRR